MTMTKTRRFLTAAAVTAGIGSVAVGVAPGAANAAPNSHVPGTNCTVAQVEAAVQVVAPEALTFLDSIPNGRAQAERVILQQPATRQRSIANLSAQNPWAAAYYARNRATIDRKIATVRATCSRY